MKLIFSTIILISSNAWCADPVKTSLDACLKSKEIEFCNKIEDFKKNIEKTAQKIIKHVNPELAGATGIIVKIAAEKKIEFPMGEYQFGKPKIRLTPDEFYLTIGYQF